MKSLNSSRHLLFMPLVRRIFVTIALLSATQSQLQAYVQPEPPCDSVTIRQIHKNYRLQVRNCREELKAIEPQKSRYNRILYHSIVKGEKERFKKERDSLLTQAIERDYLNNLTSYRSSWSNLIPSYSKIQLAGGIGTVSAGPGWDYGRKSQWETDLLIGYLPKYDSKEWKITLSLKQNYIPWQIQLGRGPFQFSPLVCGAYGSLILGGDFWIREPFRYPDRSYYRFPTRLRGHIFIGERITLNIKPGMSRAHKSISFYYEICTHDLALMSIFTNKYLTLKDATSLAFGLKFQIF
ncbi:MAG: hypothetical protein IKD16_03960 [Bacteroidales bacterium]|nr:hypothetical protein [Bacteroidales bacterium]